ncbi:hypothetical protein DYB31_011405 [Aphanomyces astaci]|uniref:Uncharacterized protein n=1 Tax=Aphanomyces astaci TaxID=112090 RepID=A0A397FD23_APHAT|nr:hypothetical protein DYB31_011405 [Aphanomyces astaci]
MSTRTKLPMTPTIVRIIQEFVGLRTQYRVRTVTKDVAHFLRAQRILCFDPESDLSTEAALRSTQRVLAKLDYKRGKKKKSLGLRMLKRAFEDLQAASIKGCINKADRQLYKLAEYIKEQEEDDASESESDRASCVIRKNSRFSQSGGNGNMHVYGANRLVLDELAKLDNVAHIRQPVTAQLSPVIFDDESVVFALILQKAWTGMFADQPLTITGATTSTPPSFMATLTLRC